MSSDGRHPKPEDPEPDNDSVDTEPPLDDDGKIDLEKHPGFYPMAEEDRLKPGESIAIFFHNYRPGELNERRENNDEMEDDD